MLNGQKLVKTTIVVRGGSEIVSYNYYQYINVCFLV